MSTATIILNESLIRLAKGMIKAWETWVQEQKKETKNK